MGLLMAKHGNERQLGSIILVTLKADAIDTLSIFIINGLLSLLVAGFYQYYRTLISIV